MSGCPFHAALQKKQAQAEKLPSSASGLQTASAEHDRKTTSSSGGCPLGFGSGSNQHVGKFHCVLCKSLLYDASRCSPCEHVFCHFCIAQFRDCPICGSDISSLEPDVEIQGKADMLLAAHSSPELLAAVGSTRVLDADASDKAAAQSPGNSSSPAGSGSLAVSAAPANTATYLLQLGLQSMRGGNFVAALDRLELSKAHMLGAAQGPKQQVTAQLAGNGSSTGGSAAPSKCPFHQQHQGEVSATTSPHSDTQPPARSSTGGQCPVMHNSSRPAQPLPGKKHGQMPVITTHAPADIPAASACQVATVLGAQGDCCKALGDLQRGAALYSASVTALQAAAAPCLGGTGQGPGEASAGGEAGGQGLEGGARQGPASSGNLAAEEAAHTLSVSLNKLGDVHFLMQDYPGALSAYQRALHVRQQLLSAAATRVEKSHAQPEQPLLSSLPGAEPQYVGRALDVVACYIKLADAAAAAAFAASHASPAAPPPAGEPDAAASRGMGTSGAVAPEPSGASDSSPPSADQPAAAGDGKAAGPAAGSYHQHQAEFLRQAGDMLKGLSLGGAPLLEQCQRSPAAAGAAGEVDPRLLARAQQLQMALASVQGSTVQA